MHLWKRNCVRTTAVMKKKEEAISLSSHILVFTTRGIKITTTETGEVIIGRTRRASKIEKKPLLHSNEEKVKGLRVNSHKKCLCACVCV